MLIRRQTTNLLQIFCELSLYFQVISKSMKAADDIWRGTRECEWVKIAGRRGGYIDHVTQRVATAAL